MFSPHLYLIPHHVKERYHYFPFERKVFKRDRIRNPVSYSWTQRIGTQNPVKGQIPQLLVTHIYPRVADNVEDQQRLSIHINDAMEVIPPPFGNLSSAFAFFIEV